MESQETTPEGSRVGTPDSVEVQGAEGPGLPHRSPIPRHQPTPTMNEPLQFTSIPHFQPGLVQSTPMVPLSQAQMEMEWRKFEAEQARLERKEERELQMKREKEEQDRLERERERERELEIRREELALKREIEMRRLGIEEERSRAGVTRNFTSVNGGRPDDGESRLAKSLKLVPAFDENEVTEWFIRFEKKAREFEWPRERWVALVSNVLKGKALKAYDKMGIEDLEDYEEFKDQILKAYELRPEAYRLQFRGARKRPHDSYVNFARYLEETFRKWVRSECVTTKSDLEELVLMEHFTNSAEREISAKIREKRFKSLKEAAMWADDRVLAMRSASGRYSVGSMDKSATNSHDKSKSYANTSKSSLKGNDKGELKNASTKTPIECYLCHRKGHIKSNCPRLKSSDAKPVALVVAHPEGGAEPDVSEFGRSVCSRGRSPVCTPAHGADDSCLRQSELVRQPQEWCRPFCSEGKVTLAGQEYPIIVARDTAAQVSVLRNPTGRQIVSKEYISCKGVFNDQFLPLVSVMLECPLVTVQAEVAIVDQLPVDGVDFLLGNDLAGGKVFPSPPPPVVAAEECYPDTGSDGLECDMEDLYPVCAVTRSMSRMSKEDESVEEEQNLSPDPVLEESVAGGFCVEEDDGGETQCRTPTSIVGAKVPEAEGTGTVDQVLVADGQGGDCNQTALSVGPSDNACENQDVCTEGADCVNELPTSSDITQSTSEGVEEGSVGGGSPRGRPRLSRELSPLSDLPQTFEEVCSQSVLHCDLPKITSAELVQAQREDASLQAAHNRAAEGKRESDEEEFFLKEDVLYRRWMPVDGERSQEVTQLAVPERYRSALLSLAHEGPLAGHLGIAKTFQRLQRRFWWPAMRKSVSAFVQCCHTCQVVGKPAHAAAPVPLHPIPAIDPPFTRVMIDIVGPLPPTSAGNKYLLTLMDVTTRYPEAIPIRSIHAKVVVKVLLGFFSKFGLPKEVQSDRGVNFTSKLFEDSMKEWGVSHIMSSAYHPQSQGALERYHHTLKVMLRSFCLDHQKDWDQAIPYVLFAVREVPTESLGFSPNDLVFGHRVRGPLDVVRDKWCGEQPGPESMLEYVLKSRERMLEARDLARKNLEVSQKRMKTLYDRKAQVRELHVGDEVLALLPVHGRPLAARYSGPYRVLKKVGDIDYVLSTPDRRKPTQLCHINMLKKYYRPESPVVAAPKTKVVVGAVSRSDPDDESNQGGCVSSGGRELLQSVIDTENQIRADLGVSDDESGTPEEEEEVMGVDVVVPATVFEGNSREALVEMLQHLSEDQRNELVDRLWQFPKVFSETPGLTSWVEHDIDVGDSKPIKLPPYRLNPQRQAALDKELKYMIDHGLIKRAYSEWCSPVTLQPKPDGKVRLCVDFRKINALSTTDSYPLPRVDDSVDQVGNARYITKIDLMKGYWQVPLTPRAKKIASFVVSGAVYQCQVMPYGLKNAPATFQRLMNRVVDGIPNCTVYIDDVVIYDIDWEEHLDHVEQLVRRLDEAGLVVNLAKCEFVKARVQYLGFVVGHGEVVPPQAKVEAIVTFERPHSRRALQRFLGMIGYYRRFIKDYSSILAPLTDLLAKNTKWKWSEECEQAFTTVKNLLSNFPILRAPDFDRPFVIAVDASRVGVGAVLFQSDDNGIEHPVSYFSKKLSRAQRNYSTIEQELLAIVLALQHFCVYVPPFGPEVVIYSDHHPLQFLHKFKFKNQRLTRWSLLLQEYNLRVRHIRGQDNVMADCLSRVGTGS